MQHRSAKQIKMIEKTFAFVTKNVNIWICMMLTRRWAPVYRIQIETHTFDL